MITVKQVILMEMQASGDQTYKQLVKAIRAQQTEVSEIQVGYEDRLLLIIGNALYSLCNDHGYVFFDHHEQAYALTELGSMADADLI